MLKSKSKSKKKKNFARKAKFLIFTNPTREGGEKILPMKLDMCAVARREVKKYREEKKKEGGEGRGWVRYSQRDVRGVVHKWNFFLRKKEIMEKGTGFGRI